MSPELAELYGELVLDHGKSPRNFRPIAAANRRAEGYNPLCGDEIRLELRVVEDRIEAIGFLGEGCAISRASASLMTQAVQGKSPAQVKQLVDAVHALLTRGLASQAELATLGKLAALGGVWRFPARVKCASLAWHTLRAALEASASAVSTE